ncbi:MAG: hypothetical protein ACLRQZ_07505 [Clostridia bacterium]
MVLAKDVAEWIEYDGTSVSSMCKLVDEDEVVKMFCTLSYSNNHPKQVIPTGSANRLFLTEDGLYVNRLKRIYDLNTSDVFKEW